MSAPAPSSSSMPGRPQTQGSQSHPRPKPKNIIDLNTYLDRDIRVKFVGGREVYGKLKGFDGLLNLVLDQTKEIVRDTNSGAGESYSGEQHDVERPLGLIVVRGPTVVTLSPMDGREEISNPFNASEQPVIEGGTL